MAGPGGVAAAATEGFGSSRVKMVLIAQMKLAFDNPNSTPHNTPSHSRL